MFKNKTIIDIITSSSIIIFGLFINRSVATDATSLGLILENYSVNFSLISDNPLSHRILLPFLSFILNIHVQTLNILLTFLFIYLIQSYLSEKLSIFYSFLITTAICTTMIFQFSVTYGGYPDVLANILLLQSYKHKNNKKVFSIYFLLLLLTHESALFLLPFFLYIFSINKTKFKEYWPLLIAVVFYFVFYFIANSNEYDVSFYFKPLLNDPFFWFKDSYNVLLIGIFSSIKFLFPYLLYCLYKLKNLRIEWFLFFMLVTSQLFIAGDVTRFYIVLFLPILVLSRDLFTKKLAPSKTYFFLILIILLNIATPKYYVFAPGEIVKVNDSRIHFLDIYKMQN